VITIKTFIPRTRTIQNLLSSSDPKSGGANKKVERIRAFLKGTVGFLFDPRSTWKTEGMADVEGEVYGGLDMGPEVGSRGGLDCLDEMWLKQVSCYSGH
jgi:hypothetical protein